MYMMLTEINELEDMINHFKKRINRDCWSNRLK